MDDDAGDVLGVFESDVLPCGAGIGGFVHAVAVIGAAGEGVVAGADPDGVGVGWRYGYGADGVEADGIGDVFEGDAVVGGFPEAAGADGGVEGVGLRYDGKGVNPGAGAEGAEVAVGELREEVG